MATLTIRNVPEAVVERLKAVAERHGRSMEQEVRELLQQRFVLKEEALRRIEESWPGRPKAGAAEIAAWIAEGRTR